MRQGPQTYEPATFSYARTSILAVRGTQGHSPIGGIWVGWPALICYNLTSQTSYEKTLFETEAKRSQNDGNVAATNREGALQRALSVGARRGSAAHYTPGQRGRDYAAGRTV